MACLNSDSLARTLDAVHEAMFYGRAVGRGDKRDVVEWIVSRVGQPGSYAGLPAPTAKDFVGGIKLYTGRRITSRAGTAHILGQEACAVLWRWGSGNRHVRKALDTAAAGFMQRLGQSDNPGMYCCMTCSCALWRHLAAGGLDHSDKRLRSGLALLKERRTEDGTWRGFPFYYVLLALSEIDLPAARSELRYAVPRCERLLERKNTGSEPYASRRGALLERIVDMS